jgi:hypothetical protein
MSLYRVYLGNPTGLGFRWQELVNAVHALLEPAIPRTTDYDRLRVESTMRRPTVGDQEVMVYVLRNQFSSLLSRRFGAHPSPRHAGLTYPHPTEGTGSEVYLQGNSVEQSARNIVHELLHNKTGMSNEQLHPLGGLCASPPAAPIDSNFDLLASSFTRTVPQWLGGFS